MTCEFCKEEIKYNESPTEMNKKSYHNMCYSFMMWVKRHKDKVKKLIEE